MNLKEAFRFQNKLQSLQTETMRILGDERNVTYTEITQFHKKVMPEVENEATAEVPPSEYADQVDQLVDFLLYLLNQQETLAAAIRKAKDELPLDMDSQISLNGTRQAVAALLRRLVDLHGSEQMMPGGGTGYRFNAEGNQVSYRCDAKRVTTINYNRHAVYSKLAHLNEIADSTSSLLDRCLVTYDVDYAAPFDVNDSFATVFEAFAEAHA